MYRVHKEPLSGAEVLGANVLEPKITILVILLPC